ncbi:MAG: methyltransferase [Acidimicrobiales bacterium]|nr:methyltransferase [Acidimicrobiales bacterium]
MDVAAAARSLNEVAYGYIGSWSLLTASNLGLFDRLPARVDDLVDEYPDRGLTATWLTVLADNDVVVEDDGVWSLAPGMDVLLTGEGSYAEYLGGQIIDQVAPRLLLGRPGINELATVLRDPTGRGGYEAWFADDAEARAYQASQFAGSVLPGRGIARAIEPTGPVLDLGGGWGAVAAAIAARHDVAVDVVDLEPVVASAPPQDGVRYLPGSALDASTWPDGDYDGVVLSYLLSSVPGEFHQPLFDQLAARGVRWVAVHDFLLGGGALAAAWSLQHAVFVPDHVSRTIDEVGAMLTSCGFTVADRRPLVDDMTTLVLAST